MALDSGIYKIWFARNYRAQPNTVVLDNALVSMDAGLKAQTTSNSYCNIA